MNAACSVKTQWPVYRSRPACCNGGSRAFPAAVHGQSGSDSGKTRHLILWRIGADRLPERGCGRAMLAEIGLVGKAPGRAG